MTVIEYEELEVKRLGDAIGYGRLMQLAQHEWRKSLEERGNTTGAEGVCGPCKAATVPCGCKGGCDWCEGAGWLTIKVKAVKDQKWSKDDAKKA